MSSSDARMFEALAERVNALEEKAAFLGQKLADVLKAYDKLAELLPKPMGDTLYGAEPDHAGDREARAALLAKRRDR